MILRKIWFKCVSDSVFFWEEVHWPPGGSFTLYFHDSRLHRKTVADCSVPRDFVPEIRWSRKPVEGKVVLYSPFFKRLSHVYQLEALIDWFGSIFHCFFIGSLKDWEGFGFLYNSASICHLHPPMNFPYRKISWSYMIIHIINTNNYDDHEQSWIMLINIIENKYIQTKWHSRCSTSNHIPH